VAQHDFSIANQSGSSFRADLNNALSAVVSQNSGSAEPTTMFAYQMWADTTAGVMKLRNGANSAWITLYELDGTFVTTDIKLGLGTAAAPSLTFTGDLITGIYSPGSGQVAISTNGTGRLFVDAGGNIGVGTSSPFSSNGTNLHVLSTGTARLWLQSTAASTGRQFYLESLSTGGLTLSDGTAGQERMRLDSSGRLGLGTSSPGERLTVAGNISLSAAQPYISLIDSGWAAGTGIRSGVNTIGTATGDYLLFNVPTGKGFAFAQNNATNSLVIDSSGRLLVGTSTSQGSYNLQCFGTGVWGQGAYVNGSDASIKQNVSDLPPSLDVVKNLRPVTFEYKPEYSQDQTIQAGFIAQELREAMQGQDYLDGIVQQGTNHLNVAYQSIIPVLTKALQEAIGRIETLEAEVAALKGA